MPPSLSFRRLPSLGRRRVPTGRLALLLAIGVLLAVPPSAWGQADTTDAAPPDSLRRPPADSTQRPAPDTAVSDRDRPLRPFPLAPPLYGRPRTDSLPGRLPHNSLELMLAERPGGFLYDLGAVGWPHGWSQRGLAPHRVHLWLDGRSFAHPLTGRARFELMPPSFLEPPRTGVDPGGGGIGVHTSWRDYDPKRPLTELRYRVDNNGFQAIEVGHSQKRRLDLFGRPGVLHLTFGFGGRGAEGVYSGSDLSGERRVWGRLRYQSNDWIVELADQSSRYRIGAHGGVQPPTSTFESIYALPSATTSVRNPDARRRTVRNDLTARVRAPLLPGEAPPTEVSATWISNTFDFRPDPSLVDTTWTTKLNGGQAFLQQSFELGRHALTASLRGHFWQVARSNVSQIEGSRGAAHLLLRDSLRLGQTHLVLDAGGHLTSEQRYPSAALQVRRSTGPLRWSASLTATGQRSAWIEDEGFAAFVQPLSEDRSGLADRLLEGTAAVGTQLGPWTVRLQGFAHQIRNAVDLYAATPSTASAPTTFTDTVVARRIETPVRRIGATLSLGWRRNAHRGLYATGHATLLETIDSQSSSLHTRLARTLPTAYGQGRIGARFVLFRDLITDLYVQARGWSSMNSRWFHPPTGRLVVPPEETPIPAVPGRDLGPSGTIDVHAEAQLRGATLFFSFENVQAGTQVQTGTFVVPVYPLPAQQFRFGVFWPIFD